MALRTFSYSSPSSGVPNVLLDGNAAIFNDDEIRTRRGFSSSYDDLDTRILRSIFYNVGGMSVSHTVVDNRPSPPDMFSEDAAAETGWVAAFPTYINYQTIPGTTNPISSYRDSTTNRPSRKVIANYHFKGYVSLIGEDGQSPTGLHAQMAQIGAAYNRGGKWNKMNLAKEASTEYYGTSGNDIEGKGARLGNVTRTTPVIVPDDYAGTQRWQTYLPFNYYGSIELDPATDFDLPSVRFMFGFAASRHGYRSLVTLSPYFQPAVLTTDAVDCIITIVDRSSSSSHNMSFQTIDSF